MDTVRKLINITIRGKKGIAAVYIALILFALVAFVGLAIDIGYMYVAKGQLQNAADAGALAGAALLNGTNDTVQTNARQAAATYGNANTVVPAGTPVQISNNNGVTNALIDSNPGNDITVGNWNSGLSPKYLEGRTPINAVQVRARRTSTSPGGAVGTFFAKVLGFADMNVASIATAELSGLGTPGLVLCDNSCSSGGSGWFYFQHNLSLGDTTGTAWTIFSDQSSVGSSDVRDFIDGKAQPTIRDDICSNSRCITTNNGVTVTLGYLDDKFRSTTWDAEHKVIEEGVVKKWYILIPLVNYQCNHTTVGGCPPYKQGQNEPYHVIGWMRAAITDIHSESYGNDKGILLEDMACFFCCDGNHTPCTDTPWKDAEQGYLHPKLRSEK